MKLILLFSIGFLLAHGVTAQTQTPAQYAESILIKTRQPVLVNQLPAYTNLLKKFDVLIQATQAANDPLYTTTTTASPSVTPAPPTVTDVDRNILIQLLGVLNGIEGALPTDPGVKAALQSVYLEIATLITQTTSTSTTTTTTTTPTTTSSTTTTTPTTTTPTTTTTTPTTTTTTPTTTTTTPTTTTTTPTTTTTTPTTTTTTPTTTTTTTTTPTTTTTTSTTIATTTTINPATFNANTWCASKPVGRYATPYSSGCKKYVYCFLNSGIKGALYTCVGTTLFDPSQGACVTGFTCI